MLGALPLWLAHPVLAGPGEEPDDEDVAQEPTRPEDASELSLAIRETYLEYKTAREERRLADALRAARKAYELALEELGDRHPQTGILAYNAGYTCLQLDRYGDAVSLLEQAVKIYQAAHGPQALVVAKPYRRLGQAYRAVGRPNDAERAYTRSIQIIEKHKGRDVEEIAHILYAMVPVAGTLGERQRVRSYGLRAIAIYSETRGPDDLRVAMLHDALARNAIAEGDFNAFQKHLEVATRIYEEKLPAGHAKPMSLYEFAAEAYKAVGMTGRAYRYRKKLAESEAAQAS